MKLKLIMAILSITLMTSCGSSNRGVRQGDGMFYRGQIVKANGERKTKVFIFGRDACVRKSKRMARKRARINSYGRNPGYGITTMGRAKQRH